MSFDSWYSQILNKSKARPVNELWDLKNCQPKIPKSLNLIAEWMLNLFDHIFAYYDLLLPLGLVEII